MVNWELAGNDSYYRARQAEERARKQGSAEAWRDFADLKASKGSYTLAVYGYMNGALICEQHGEIGRASDLFARAFHNCCRARSKDLAVIVAYRHAQLAEKAGRWATCIEVYEALGRFCEEMENYFLAADAYEHVAEIMARTGMDVASYRKPIELWERNARYWRELGHEDDEQWSAHHIPLYKSLFGAKPE
jgi:predicted DNA-binding protein